MDGTQPPRSNAPLPKGIRITLVALFAGIIGLVVGIYASHVGQLTFYTASAVGGGACVTAFTLGLIILAFLQE